MHSSNTIVRICLFEWNRKMTFLTVNLSFRALVEVCTHFLRGEHLCAWKMWTLELALLAVIDFVCVGFRWRTHESTFIRAIDVDCIEDIFCPRVPRHS